MDRSEAFPVQGVEALLTSAAHTDEADLSQDPKMLGGLRLLEAQRFGDAGDALWRGRDQPAGSGS
jgi:hypothetical protein